MDPTHVVLGTPLEGPWPDGSEVLYVAMGCFWGVERIFWRQPGVITTAAGYMGGYTPNPTYEETCTGLTGHAETVRVVYDPARTSPELLLKAFWENHDPTTANRQGNDVGTAVPVGDLLDRPERAAARGRGDPRRVPEGARRQRLRRRSPPRSARPRTPARSTSPRTTTRATSHKNPGGYCNHGPNGMTCPVGIVRQDQLPAQQDIAPPA